MKTPLPLSKTDLMLLRNSSISFLVLTTLAIFIYVSASSLQQSAAQNLNAARANFDQVSTSVTQIAQEEETIIRYIDRYIQIEEDGIVSAQDRLLLLERVTNIRESLQLYALGMSLGEQVSYVVPYPPEDPLPGDPVTINQTVINMELGLLHEGDLLRLLDELLSLPALLQPAECIVELDSSATDGLTQLRENLSARCRVNWFSFELTPPASVAQEGG
jgi:hypothetical protein